MLDAQLLNSLVSEHLLMVVFAFFTLTWGALIVEVGIGWSRGRRTKPIEREIVVRASPSLS